MVDLLETLDHDDTAMNLFAYSFFNSAMTTGDFCLVAKFVTPKYMAHEAERISQAYVGILQYLQNLGIQTFWVLEFTSVAHNRKFAISFKLALGPRHYFEQFNKQTFEAFHYCLGEKWGELLQLRGERDRVGPFELLITFETRLFAFIYARNQYRFGKMITDQEFFHLMMNWAYKDIEPIKIQWNHVPLGLNPKLEAYWLQSKDYYLLENYHTEDETLSILDTPK